MPAPSYRQVLGVAVPIMLSNLSTPLLGIVDTAVIGRLGNATAIAAVALGSMIFTIAFWAFGFLRMGTSGLTAQAVGAGDQAEQDAVVARALLLAGLLGIMLIALQAPIRSLAFWLLEGSAEVESLAHSYFDVRIWSAPAVLTNYALVGWFVGRARATTALGLQLFLNTLNMALDALFVITFNWGIAGIATGTACAEYATAALGTWLAFRQLHAMVPRAALLDRNKLLRLLQISRDIMLRTLALMLVFAWFTAQGAAFGDAILATNAILMHLVSTSAYFLDGLAHAAETFVGQALGERSARKLRCAIRRTSVCALLIALANSALIVAFGTNFVALLTQTAEIRETAADYGLWVAAAPLAGVACFQLDGIFIGATRTAQMRNAMIASTLVFFLAWWVLRPWQNHGLWAALHVHYAARTGSLLFYLLKRDALSLRLSGNDSNRDRSA